MGFSHRRKGGTGPLVVWGLVLGLAVVIFLIQDEAGWASPANGAATIFPPNRVGGAVGRNDERDADIYPASAYDPVTGRYLVVWVTRRNAQSSSDSFDVYGVFLDRTGRPVGSEFRISDSNAAARNGPPAVAAGHGEFAVAWTRRGAACQIYGPGWKHPLSCLGRHRWYLPSSFRLQCRAESVSGRLGGPAQCRGAGLSL